MLASVCSGGSMVTETLKEVLPKVIEGRAEGEQSRQLATRWLPHYGNVISGGYLSGLSTVVLVLASVKWLR